MTEEPRGALLRIEGTRNVWRGALALLAAVGTLAWSVPLFLIVGIQIAKFGVVSADLGIAVGVTLVVGVSCGWVARRIYRTCVTIEFHEHGVLVWNARRSFQLRGARWEQIQSFDDGASERVVLHFERGPRLHVPTTSEKDRVAVLALLDGHGVKRRD